ncbi:MAG: Flp family type IVb pilin [Alphaproteobacteria bacterium]|nr:Flp family type IVb pilin [Alphaproteobacteria bacterium]
MRILRLARRASQQNKAAAPSRRFSALSCGKLVPILPRAASRIGEFARDEAGTTAIEYCLIASFIFLAIVSAFQAVGVEVAALYTAIAGNF